MRWKSRRGNPAKWGSALLFSLLSSCLPTPPFFYAFVLLSPYGIKIYGRLVAVKVLGAFSMLDDGELDWKLVTVRASDPLANKLNDIEDVDKELPGTIAGIREWFRW